MNNWILYCCSVLLHFLSKLIFTMNFYLDAIFSYVLRMLQHQEIPNCNYISYACWKRNRDVCSKSMCNWCDLHMYNSLESFYFDPLLLLYQFDANKFPMIGREILLMEFFELEYFRLKIWFDVLQSTVRMSLKTE